MLDTIMILFRRWIRREPKPTLSPITEQSKRFWYRKGVEAGRKQQMTPVYGPYCERHETRLEQGERVGVYICPLCQVQAQADAVERAKSWQPEIEQHTGPIERPFFAYRRIQQCAAQDTEEHCAVQPEHQKLL